jgi:hydroxyacylglutathione hydrolase
MAAKLQVETFEVGPLENNTYLVYDREGGEAVVVDPAIGSEIVESRISSLGLRLSAVVNTHGHFDHLVNNAYFADHFSCPILIHEADLPLLEDMERHAVLFGYSVKPSPKPSGFLRPGEPLRVGSGSMEILHTPGHSPGGVCLSGDGFVIVGDTLFAQSIGRTDLPGGDFDTLLHSIRHRLYTLPDPTEVLPGHGPSTLIGFEKRHNPFVKGMVSHGD